MNDGPLPSSETDKKAARRVGRPRTIETGGASLACVLNLIRTGAATTRLDLEREAELGRAALVDRLTTLEKLGLVAAGELGAPEGGRAPRHMRFLVEAGAILAVSIERSSASVALADLSGRLTVEHHEAVDLADGPEAILERVTNLFIWLLDERGGKDRVWAIGVALPEPVLANTNDGDAFGIVSLDVLQSWRAFDFAVALSLRFKAPAWGRGGAQMMTFGEFKAGVCQGGGDLLFVKLGHSIAAGSVSGGRLHRGAQGFAGMIGHAPTGESDIVCHCGAKGCLEALASGDAIAREARAAATDGRSRYLADINGRNGEVTATDVGHGAQLGDAFCAEFLARCGRLVGASLAPLVNLLNPAFVVLGGSVTESAEVLLASVREAIYRQSHPLATRDLRILCSQLGGTAALIGASRLASDEIFSPAMLQDWIAFGSPRRLPSFLASLEAERARASIGARSETSRCVSRR
ncbi:MAG TPA: ROK family protein [Roseiarcus sp.]|nr:ROK family protein [Roseiarcus sp.]